MPPPQNQLTVKHDLKAVSWPLKTTTNELQSVNSMDRPRRRRPAAESSSTTQVHLHLQCGFCTTLRQHNGLTVIPTSSSAAAVCRTVSVYSATSKYINEHIFVELSLISNRSHPPSNPSTAAALHRYSHWPFAYKKWFDGLVRNYLVLRMCCCRDCCIQAALSQSQPAS